jgi:hypothetical protein
MLSSSDANVFACSFADAASSEPASAALEAAMPTCDATD